MHLNDVKPASKLYPDGTQRIRNAKGTQRNANEGTQDECRDTNECKRSATGIEKMKVNATGSQVRGKNP